MFWTRDRRPTGTELTTGILINEGLEITTAEQLSPGTAWMHIKPMDNGLQTLLDQIDKGGQLSDMAKHAAYVLSQPFVIGNEKDLFTFIGVAAVHIYMKEVPCQDHGVIDCLLCRPPGIIETEYLSPED